MATVTNVGAIAVHLRANTQHFSSSMVLAQSTLNRFGKSATLLGTRMRTLGRGINLHVSLPIVLALAAMTKAFSTFEAKMRNVNTIAKQNEVQFAKTSAAVLKLATEIGKKPVELTEALYDINSASFQAAEGLKVLKAAAFAGQAGISSTKSAAKAITGILNAYGMSADKAGDVSDILFKTVERGVITFEELSAHMGDTVATAAIAKVPFEQVAAAIATMTRGGIQSAETFTAMNRFLMRMVKGGPELDKVFAGMGHESALAALQQEGLLKVMERIIKVTKSDAKAIQALGFEMRAFKAVASLARNEGKDFASDIETIANKAVRAGATMDAFREQTKALQHQMKRVQAAALVLAIIFGQLMAPAIKKIANGLESLIKHVSSMSEKNKKLTLSILAIAAVLGPVIMLLGFMAAGLGAVVSFIPLILVLGVAFVALRKILKAVTGDTSFFFAALRIWLVEGMKNFLQFSRVVWEEMKFVAKAIWLAMQIAFDNITTYIETLITNWGRMTTWITDNWAAMGKRITSFWKSILVNLGKNIWSFAKAVGAWLLDPFGGFEMPDFKGLLDDFKVPPLTPFTLDTGNYRVFEDEVVALAAKAGEAINAILVGKSNVAGTMAALAGSPGEFIPAGPKFKGEHLLDTRKFSQAQKTKIKEDKEAARQAKRRASLERDVAARMRFGRTREEAIAGLGKGKQAELAALIAAGGKKAEAAAADAKEAANEQREKDQLKAAQNAEGLLGDIKTAVENQGVFA